MFNILKKKKKVKLEKSLSPINVFSLAVGSIIGWGTFVMPGNLFLKTAGPLGTAIGMAIGALIMSIIAISYGYMVEKFPVAGGEFAFSFKGFGRNHAFVCAWLLGLSYLSIVPLNATALAMIGRYMFPGVLQRGLMYSIAGWEVYLGEVLFASIALIIFAITSIKGIKVSGVLQTIMSFILVGAILILTIVAFLRTDNPIDNLKPFFGEGIPPLSGILTIVAIAPWAYVGFDSIPQAAEEFDFSPKKALKIMIAAIVFGGLMYISMNTVTAMVLPWDSAMEGNPFWITGDAIESLLGNVGLVLLGLALISAIIAGIIGFYMAASRLLLSMARAKALPSWFGKIHPKYHTPVNALKFVLLISLITPWFGRQVLTWVVDMASIGAAIGYFYTSASAFKFLRKEKGKMYLKIFSVLGCILAIGFVLLLIVPGMPAYLSLPSRIALFVWIALGIIFYISIRKSYQELPREELNRLIIKRQVEK
ncbi:APC family permease [Senegalia massiliensis]|uniref:APC family permease n=1 Tax=Senegalia massiliensis TaxID=1720316 RepID=UPI00102FE080|nr:APC family permease [Senegalia massiliensis]